MKIYTRGGDKGSTGLYGGARVDKGNPRIDCIGAVDELNAMLGFCAADRNDQLSQQLRIVQAELFVIGSELSAPEGAAGLPRLHSQTIDRLEHEIDAAEEKLPPMRNFILPGGSELAARLHLARTICRRAERRVSILTDPNPSPLVLSYLNRLSDWLFVQARLANHLSGLADIPWRHGA